MLAVPGFATLDQALTSLLYSGEQTDSTGLQYLRARFYDPASGRFNRMDPFAGNFSDPLSLHKYLYTHGDPVNGVDPSGEIYVALFAALDAYGIYLEGVTAGFAALAAGEDAIEGFKYGVLVSAGIGAGTYVGFRLLSPYAGAVFRAVRVNSGYWARLFGGRLFSGRLADLGTGFVQRGRPLLNRIGDMRLFNADNFRYNLATLWDLNPPPAGYDAHHVFPQKLRSRFRQLGVDIDDPAFGAWW